MKMRKKSNDLLSAIRKVAMGAMVCLGMMATTQALTACSSSDDDNLEDHINKESEKFHAYWGENLAYLQGVCVEEADKNNPNAGYTEIKSDGTFTSVNMLDSSRSRSGYVGQVVGDVKMLDFRDSWGNWGAMIHSEWADNSHTRIKTYRDGMDPNKYTVYWVKLNGIPANWQK